MSVDDVREFAKNLSIRFATVVNFIKPKRMVSYDYSKPRLDQVFPAVVRPINGIVKV